MAWTQEKVQEIVKIVQEKATTDAAFKARVKADPKAVAEEIAGIQVPAGFKIKAVDMDEADITVILPKTSSDELSDMELEAVAGGKGGHKNTNNGPELVAKQITD